jgi:Family of unknown function (DUF6978)
MAELNLTQAEADTLIALEKHRADESLVDYPAAGESAHLPLVSADGREHFILDLTRSGRIDLLKGTYQNRARKVVVLARLDFGGRPHRNPDDSEVASPHLHTYREGYATKWAIPLPPGLFTDLDDRWQMLLDFMRFCNITKPPRLQKGLYV